MYKISAVENFLLVELHGQTNFSTIIEVIAELFKRPDYSRNNDVWNFGTEVLDLRFEQLKEISDFIALGYPENAIRTKTALVVPTGFNRAITELWTTTTESLAYETKVFSTMPLAVDWVNG